MPDDNVREAFIIHPPQPNGATFTGCLPLSLIKIPKKKYVVVVCLFLCLEPLTNLGWCCVTSYSGISTIDIIIVFSSFEGVRKWIVVPPFIIWNVEWFACLKTTYRPAEYRATFYFLVLYFSLWIISASFYTSVE